MTVSRLPHKAARIPAGALHRWLPVLLALVLAVAAGWSIMALNGASYRARQDKTSVPALQSGVVQSEQLLLATAKKRLAAHGAAALKPVAGAPPRMAVYYADTFQQLTHLGAATGTSDVAGGVSRTLLAMTVTQDAIYRGGKPGLAASRRAPAVIAALRGAFSTLDQRLASRAQLKSRLASGGTMLIMLVAALSLILLLRRFDHLR